VAGLALLLLVTAAAGWLYVRGLSGNIVTDVTTARELARHEKERPAPDTAAATDVLLLGTGDETAPGVPAAPDAVFLLHLAPDGRSAAAVGFPGDLLVDVPGCTAADGTRAPARRTTLDEARREGGTACVIRALEGLTGIRLDHHVTVDFAAVPRVVDALGGVEPRVAGGGRQVLDGAGVAAWLRAADGEERAARQREFLDALVRKAGDGGVLLNPARLFPVLEAITSSLTTDAELDSLGELYELLRRVRAVPRDKIEFRTVPGVPESAGLAPDTAQVNELFTRLREAPKPTAP
jgi:LCP family protein required for cell wall assembly